MIALIVIVWPLWSYFGEVIDPNTLDSIYTKFSIPVAALIGLTLTYTSRFIRLNVSSLYAVLSSALILQVIYLAGVNKISDLYFFGSMLAFFCASLGYLASPGFAIFCACSLISPFLWIEAEGNQSSRLFYFVVMATTAMVSYINVLAKTNLIKQVNKRHDHMERVIDQFPIATIYLEQGQARINNVMQSLIGKRQPFYNSITEVLDICFTESEDNERIRQLQSELKTKGKVKPTHLIFAPQGSEHRNVEVTAYKDEMSEIWTMRDETEKLAAQANMTYSAKMASLGEMAGGIAHEINNPLTIIKGTTEILAKQISDGSITPDEAEKLSQRVSNTVSRIATIVSGLRKFSHSDENQPMQSCNFNEILEDALDLCQERLRAGFVKLDCIIPNTPILIRCQPIEISQIMINLINNASDAVASQEEKWITVIAVEQHDVIQIRVTNSGPRIPEKIAVKIMQPFFTTKEIGEGTGLGLSISKGIAEQHGGSLTLDQSFCHTCFVLTLPKVEISVKSA